MSERRAQAWGFVSRIIVNSDGGGSIREYSQHPGWLEDILLLVMDVSWGHTVGSSLIVLGTIHGIHVSEVAPADIPP